MALSLPVFDPLETNTASLKGMAALRAIRLAAVEPGDLTRHFALVFLLFQILTFVAGDFALGDAEFDFDSGTLPVSAKGNEGVPFNLTHTVEPHDFLPVQQQSADPFRIMLFPTRLRVGLDVASVKKTLTVFHAGKRIPQVDPAVPDRLDFGAL